MTSPLPKNILLVDFEFRAPTGEPPEPICAVVRNLGSGRTSRFWEDQLRQMKSPPYPTDESFIFVAYYTPAELACHLALGWELPEQILDLYVEFRNETNGLELPHGRGLLGALAYYGLDSIGAAEKQAMRELALRGGPWTAEERNGLLDYCETDVVALGALLEAMAPRLDLDRALIRGQMMTATAKMERIGIPINRGSLDHVRSNWQPIRGAIISRTDRDYGVFENGSFRAERWLGWARRNEIEWPCLPSGKPALDENTFKAMSELYPKVRPIHELRSTLAKMKLESLAVGKDGRNRTMLSPFSSVTGRNQPSSVGFIFGLPAWARGFIQPAPNSGIAYIDYSQQEFGIAAALSRDPTMTQAYLSGDPYLAFAKQAGAAPADATKASHESVRDLFKSVILATQYQMGPQAFASKTAASISHARELLGFHRETFARFWRWSEDAVNYAMMNGRIHTAFGWNMQVTPFTKLRTVQNFPMQANGAEILRFACYLALRRGVHVCAPVHDAILIEAPSNELDEHVAVARQAMEDASALVLDGFHLRSEATLFRAPEHYQSSKGERMWNMVWEELGRLPSPNHTCAPAPQGLLRAHTPAQSDFSFDLGEDFGNS